MAHIKGDALGEVLKSARRERKMTQEKLGEIVDLSQRYIMSIENEHKKPSFDKLFMMIRTLGVNANNIFYPERPEDDTSLGSLFRMISQCDERELRLITAIVETILVEKNE